MLAAISFDLRPGRHSLLTIKNTTDETQNIDLVLDHEQGSRHYIADLAPFPPQQVRVVDIKRLRDQGVPDRTGKILLSATDSGGSVLFGAPGAFICSDPTFFASTGSRELIDSGQIQPGHGLPGEPGAGSGSCATAAHDRPPPPPPPAPHSYPRSPFDGKCTEFGPGCRLAQIPGDPCFHRAQDIATDPPSTVFGQQVRAMEDGTLVDFGPAPGDPGLSAVIIKSGPFLTFYGHVRAPDNFAQRLGTVIHRGEVIGVTDNSGFFRGTPTSHVHLARLPSLGGIQDDYENVAARECNGGGTCNFNVNCSATQ